MVKKIFCCGLALLFCCLNFVVRGQEDSIRFAKFDELVKSYADMHMFSGAVLVSRGGSVLFQKGYGKANIEWDIENTAKTKFPVASLSKSFTATLVMQLVQENKLSLGDFVSKYLPDFPEDKASQITIHHLLSNTSGLPNYFHLDGWADGAFRKDISDNDFLKEIGNLGLSFQPGSSYLYSSAGYFLLGEIIEVVTEMSFAEAMKQYVFDPLEMNNSGIIDNKQIVKNIAEGYLLSANGGFVKQGYMNMNLFKAAGNAYSTAEDILKWDMSFDFNQLLTEDSKSILFDPENKYAWEFDSLMIEGVNDTIAVSSFNGQIDGYSSMITRFIDDQVSIIILGNTGIGYLAKKKLTNDLIKVLYNAPTNIGEKDASLFITKSIYDNKLEEGIAQILNYKMLFKADEEVIYELGTQFSWAGENDVALQLFELNAKLFPNSPSAVFQVAEAFREAGKMDKAIPYYNKVIQHYPNNSYVKRLLEQAAAQ